jgi:hypothetical protein
MPSRRPLLPLVLLFVLCAAASPNASAQQIRINSDGNDSLSQVVPRMALHEARHAIVNRDGTVALLLTRGGVLLQFTDRGLEQAISSKDEEHRTVLAEVLSGMLRGGLRSLLDRGIEYPLSDLKETRYEGGRLYFVRHDGQPVFEDVQVNDVAVMESFSARDARGFVARFQDAKAGR